MRKPLLLSFLMLWTLCCVAHSQTANQNVAPPREERRTDTEAAVKKAFAELEKGNYEAALNLPRSIEVIQYLEPYSLSASEAVRAHVVGFLGTVKATEAAVPLLTRGVGDAARRNAEMASDILYKNFDRPVLENNSELRDALVKSVAGGNDSIAATALLGYFPTHVPAAKLLGDQCAEIKNNKRKLDYFAAQRSLAACVVSSGIGTEKGAALLEKFRAGREHSFHFFLVNLELIEDPDVLRVLFMTAVADDSPLDDVFVELGVARPDPAREPRFADLAVNKFAERLKINVGFLLTEDKRYGKPQIVVARRRILAEIARLKNKE